MENWQREYILQNLQPLTENTICHASLMARLNYHFSRGETDLMEARCYSTGKNAEAKLLYELAINKKNIYKLLMSALEEEFQSGACKILFQGVLKRGLWSDLTDKQKEEIKNKSVNFQGNLIKLVEFQENLHLIDGAILIELETGKTPMMLAETYIGEAARYSELRHANIATTSIFEMYQTHIKRRLQENKRCRVEFYDFNAIKRAHMYHALELLFPEDITQFKNLTSANSTIPVNQLCRYGILEVTNINSVRFVHRTFAEYLVAWFVLDDDVTKDASLGTFMLSRILSTKASYKTTQRESLYLPTRISSTHVLSRNFLFSRAKFRFNSPVVCDFINEFSRAKFRFNSPVVCYFINEFTKCHPLLASQLVNVSTMLHQKAYRHCEGRVFASICHNLPYVLVKIKNLFESENENCAGKNSYLGELLLLTAMHSDVDLMMALCDGLDLTKIHFPFDDGTEDDNFRITPLHVAIARGHYNLVEYLVNKFGSGLTDLSYLFHFCVTYTKKENHSTLSSKKEIIQLLMTKSRQWTEERINDCNSTPLLQDDVHWKMLECLLEAGASVNALDIFHQTLLHKLGLDDDDDVSPETYHRIIVLLCERGFKHFNLRRGLSCSETPVHLVLKKIELLDETMQLLHKNGVDFNATDEYGNSVLFYAIKGGRSLHLIRKLIEYGANFHHQTNYRGNVLHFCAKFGNTDALRFFLEVHQMDINVLNGFAKTPLHVVVKRRSKNHEHIQHILITNGADVNATDSDLTPFFSAFRHRGISLDIINLMEAHGLKVDKEVYSLALKIAIWNTEIELDNSFGNVLMHLIEKGGTFGSTIEEDPWNFEAVKNVMQEIEVTDELLHRAKILSLLTAQELNEVATTKESLKTERFYTIVKGRQGSFEKVLICLICSNQAFALTKFRGALKIQLGNEVDEYFSCAT